MSNDKAFVHQFKCPMICYVTSSFQKVPCMKHTTFQNKIKSVGKNKILRSASMKLFGQIGLGCNHRVGRVLSVSPVIGIGTPPPLQPQASVPPHPQVRGGGHTRLRLKWWGSPNSNEGTYTVVLYIYKYFVGVMKHGGVVAPPRNPSHHPPTPSPFPLTHSQEWIIHKVLIYIEHHSVCPSDGQTP